MKFSFLRHWGLYVALLVLLGPMVLIWAIEPNWVARTVGEGPYIFVLTFIAFYVSIRRSKDYFGRDSPIYKWSRKVYIDNGARILLFAFGVFSTYVSAIPFTQDLLLIYRGQAPIERTAYVANTRSLLANISEEVILDTYPQKSLNDHFTASYFSPRHIMTGNTYKFLYLPNSRIIVEAIPVEIINK